MLGIDTSGYANTVGVVDDGRILAELTYEARTDSLEQIFTNIDDALKNAAITLKDVGGIGVGLGPGSWTGIRVGVTVGKMLAFSTDRPVAGIPTLEALAFGLHNESHLVCAVVNVGAGDAVYAALYRLENKRINRIGDYYVGDIEGLTVLVTEPALIVGTGARSYACIMSKESRIEIDAMEARPSGLAVASLAAQRLERGESDDVLSLTPLYLKESTAKAFIDKYKGSHM